MIILWDENKRKTNLEKHGLDFADFKLDFLEYATIEETYSKRFKSVFEFNNQTIIVIFRFLGKEAFSLISMRPANRKERGLLK